MTEEEEYQAWKEEQEYQEWKGGLAAEEVAGKVDIGGQPPAPLKSGLMPESEGFLKGASDPGAAITKLGLRTGPGLQYPETGELQKQFDERQKRQEEVYQAQRSAEGDTGLDWDRMGGEAAATLPLGFSAVRAAAPATTLGRMGAGTASGTGYSQIMTTPEENLNPPASDKEYWDRQKAKAKVGAAMGAALPLTFGVAGKAKKYVSENIIDPWKKAGRKREIDRFLRGQTGDDRERISDALIAAKEQVPGSSPTSAQAIAQSQVPGDEFGNTIAKLEREVASEPVTGMPLKRQYAKQRGARKDVVDAVAGTDQQMAAAKNELTASTSQFSPAPLYKQAEKSTAQVTRKPIISKIDDYIKNNSNEDDIVRPLRVIRAKLTKGGNSVREAMSLSRQISKMMGKITPGGQKEFNVGALKEVKSVLDNQIGMAEKKFSIAQKLFQRKMRPIDRMNTGKDLRTALVDASLQETPKPYLKAMRDAQKTLAKSTKFKRHQDFGQVLTPEQTAGVKGVGADLETVQVAKGLTKDMKTVLGQLPSEVELRLPKILSRPIVIANHVLVQLAKNTKPEYQKLLAQTLKDPMELHKALQLPVESARRRMAIDMMRELSIYAGVQDNDIAPEFKGILTALETQ